MKVILKHLKPYRAQFITGSAFKLLEALLEVTLPVFMAKLIDEGIKTGDRDVILIYGAYMLLIAVVGIISASICQYYAAFVSQSCGTSLRSSLFKHINNLSLSQLDEVGGDSLTTRVTSDTINIQTAVALTMRLVFRAPFLCVGCIIAAMLVDVKMSAVFLAAVPLFILILIFVMYKSVPLYSLIQKKLDGLSVVIRENLSGVRVIRAFRGRGREVARFTGANGSLAATSIKAELIASLLYPGTTLIMNLAIIAIIWFGGMRVDGGNMSQGELVAFINYMTQILNALIVIANLMVVLTRAIASNKRIGEVFAMSPHIVFPSEDRLTPDPNAPVSASDTPAVEFTDVSFSYGGEEKELDGISFILKRGETLGIIGKIGAGKSTLIGLIERFYERGSGEIRLFGHDVRSYSLPHLRGLIGLVPQKALLFSGSVEKNLLLAAGADGVNIISAAEISQSSAFIEAMPDKYASYVKRGGSNLSGGQRQRLTIARALAGKPELLILDDSFSALDFRTDKNLRRALRERCGGMSVIIVSQRVSTIAKADNILVLDEGVQAGFGTHEALLSSCPQYREIALSQLSSGGEDK
ncbi:MAG: ABC transporter ATP-binding protein [Eubacteriales bacterium]